MQEKVELCGVDTARLPVLSEAEKSRLIKAARAGGQAGQAGDGAGQSAAGVKCCTAVCGPRREHGRPVSGRCIGLIKAIDNFDPAQNVRFSTYGVPMIVGEVKRACGTTSAVRVSRSIRDLAYHSMQAREELQKAERARAEALEIAARVGQEPGERRYGAGIRCDADEPV